MISTQAFFSTNSAKIKVTITPTEWLLWMYFNTNMSFIPQNSTIIVSYSDSLTEAAGMHVSTSMQGCCAEQNKHMAHQINIQQ